MRSAPSLILQRRARHSGPWTALVLLAKSSPAQRRQVAQNAALRERFDAAEALLLRLSLAYKLLHTLHPSWAGPSACVLLLFPCTLKHSFRIAGLPWLGRQVEHPTEHEVVDASGQRWRCIGKI